MLGPAGLALAIQQRHPQLSGVRYLVGDLTARAGGRLMFAPTSGGALDTGPTFYAPQVLVEPDRVLLWGCAWEGADRTAEEIAAAGWCGTLTLPRELFLFDGAVICRPAAELASLRREPIDYQRGTPLGLTAHEVSARDGLRLRLIDASVSSGWWPRWTDRRDFWSTAAWWRYMDRVRPTPHGPTHTPTTSGSSTRPDRSQYGGSDSIARPPPIECKVSGPRSPRTLDPSLPYGTVFADFEGATWGTGWTATGNFTNDGPRPGTIGDQQPVIGYQATNWSTPSSTTTPPPAPSAHRRSPSARTTSTCSSAAATTPTPAPVPTRPRST